MRVLLVGAGASFSTKDVEDGYYNSLKRLPNCDVKFFLLDKRVWIADNWLNYFWRKCEKKIPKPEWRDAIYRASIEALEMALRFEVDWVVLISGMFFHGDAIVLMRRAGLKVSMLFTESPFNDRDQGIYARDAGINGYWINERTSVPILEQYNPNVAYMRHAYDPDKHIQAPNDDKPKHDVVFIGSAFSERIDLLSGVNWDGIDLGLYGAWELLGSRSKLRQYLRGGLTRNDNSVAIYSNAKIGLNLYRTDVEYMRGSERVSTVESMNPRAYELAATSTFQLSQPRAEQTETLGSSVPTFTTSAELEDQIRYYLAHPHERAEKAYEARELIAPHTFDVRARQMVTTLEGYTNG